MSQHVLISFNASLETPYLGNSTNEEDCFRFGRTGRYRICIAGYVCGRQGNDEA